MAFVDQPRQQYGFDIYKHESCAKTLSYRYTSNQVDFIFWNNGRVVVVLLAKYSNNAADLFHLTDLPVLCYHPLMDQVHHRRY